MRRPRHSYLDSLSHRHWMRTSKRCDQDPGSSLQPSGSPGKLWQIYYQHFLLPGYGTHGGAAETTAAETTWLRLRTRPRLWGWRLRQSTMYSQLWIAISSMRLQANIQALAQHQCQVSTCLAELLVPVMASAHEDSDHLQVHQVVHENLNGSVVIA